MVEEQEAPAALANEPNRGRQRSGANPVAAIGIAFVLGIVAARWLDWRDRARVGL